MEKTLVELTSELQTLCHEGYSNCPVNILVLDGFYKLGNVLKTSIGNTDEDSRTVISIEARGYE